MSTKGDINKVDRSMSRLTKLKDFSDEKSKCTPSELMDFIWDLTVEVYSLNGKFDAQQRLQRNVTNLVRQRG